MDITRSATPAGTAPSGVDQIEIKNSVTIDDIRSLGDGAFMKIDAESFEMSIASSTMTNLYSSTKGSLLYIEKLGKLTISSSTFKYFDAATGGRLIYTNGASALELVMTGNTV